MHLMFRMMEESWQDDTTLLLALVVQTLSNRGYEIGAMMVSSEFLIPFTKVLMCLPKKVLAIEVALTPVSILRSANAPSSILLFFFAAFSLVLTLRFTSVLQYICISLFEMCVLKLLSGLYH